MSVTWKPREEIRAEPGATYLLATPASRGVWRVQRWKLAGVDRAKDTFTDADAASPAEPTHDGLGMPRCFIAVEGA